MQPEEHALDEGLCNPEPDLIPEAGKQSPPDSRSSTCVPLTFGETADSDTADAGTDSRHSFFSKSSADGTDHSRPPNRLLHDHHNSRMEGFLKAAWVNFAKLTCNLFASFKSLDQSQFHKRLARGFRVSGFWVVEAFQKPLVAVGAWPQEQNSRHRLGIGACLLEALFCG